MQFYLCFVVKETCFCKSDEILFQETVALKMKICNNIFNMPVFWEGKTNEKERTE